MTVQDKMKMTAAVLSEKIRRGEKISKEDARFLKSFMNIKTRKAPNGGKTRKYF